MLMLRSFTPAINLRKSREKTTQFFFCCSFYWTSLTSGYLWYASFIFYAAKDNSEKKTHYSRVFAFIRVELRALLISGPPSRMRMGQSCKAEILIKHRKSVFHCFSPHYLYVTKQMKKPKPCTS